MSNDTPNYASIAQSLRSQRAADEVRLRKVREECQSLAFDVETGNARAKARAGELRQEIDRLGEAIARKDDAVAGAERKHATQVRERREAEKAAAFAGANDVMANRVTLGAEIEEKLSELAKLVITYEAAGLAAHAAVAQHLRSPDLAAAIGPLEPSGLFISRVIAKFGWWDRVQVPDVALGSPGNVPPLDKHAELEAQRFAAHCPVPVPVTEAAA